MRASQKESAHKKSERKRTQESRREQETEGGRKRGGRGRESERDRGVGCQGLFAQRNVSLRCANQPIIQGIWGGYN